ncbi:hypothetical protein [Ensifer soli]|uniref:hypothetical protein n=1 Tax=Ciceribacter sp. sgz301302 TaxID=3342379 RepID=UPI0035BB5844
MSYGFDKPVTDTVKLPPQRQKAPEAAAPAVEPAPDLSKVLQAGQSLGFVSRDVHARRKPGPKRKEAQDKISVTGPKRVIERLKAYCDANGGQSYCEAIEALLDTVEGKGK